jgi:hypothetical protein
MLPLGNVRAWQTRDNWTHFTKDEQFTLMTLWCIARSPLILGGNLPKNDEFTLALLTNDEVLAVNQNSTNNRQLFNTNNTVAWLADVPHSKDKYLALFNTAPGPEPHDISVSFAEIGFTGSAKVRDLWNHKDLGAVTGKVTQTINSHGAGFYRLQPEN